MHAKLCGEVYGYKSSRAEAFRDIESRAIDCNLYCSLHISLRSFRERQSIASFAEKSEDVRNISKDDTGPGLTKQRRPSSLLVKKSWLG